MITEYGIKLFFGALLIIVACVIAVLITLEFDITNKMAALGIGMGCGISAFIVMKRMF